MTIHLLRTYCVSPAKHSQIFRVSGKLPLFLYKTSPNFSHSLFWDLIRSMTMLVVIRYMTCHLFVNWSRFILRRPCLTYFPIFSHMMQMFYVITKFLLRNFEIFNAFCLQQVSRICKSITKTNFELFTPAKISFQWW